MKEAHRDPYALVRYRKNYYLVIGEHLDYGKQSDSEQNVGIQVRGYRSKRRCYEAGFSDTEWQTPSCSQELALLGVIVAALNERAARYSYNVSGYPGARDSAVVSSR